MIMLKNGGIYAVGKPQDVITEYSVSDVYDVKCKVVDDNGRPHVILIDKDDCGCDDCIGSFVKDCL